MAADGYADLLPYLTPAERKQLVAALAADPVIWRPNPGAQLQAYECKADVIGYGGAAGGGKTDLACGLALTKHKVAAIFRRQGTEMTAIEDRIAALTGGRDGFNSKTNIWRLPGRQIEFGSCPNPGDETKYQGRPKDLLVLDEATNFLEPQARYLMGWVRTTDPNQKCTVLLTFNPPTTAEGRWIIAFFAPWLDPKHPNPAFPGEIRWFAMIDGEEVERENGEPFEHNGETIRPQSRTFIPSRLKDNPHLMGTAYMTQLQALPEPLRSQMLHGDFLAGTEDDAMQVIPTAWVDAAMDRWKKRESKGLMDSMGVDVARGGRDNEIISRRHGLWFDDLLTFKGSETPDGQTSAERVVVNRRNGAVVHIDIIGWGSSPHDVLVSAGADVVGFNGSEATLETTADAAKLHFANKRALVWWRMREALDPDRAEQVELPPDAGLRSDLCAPTWRMTAGKQSAIQVESKDEIRKRLGRSPDKGDAVVMANIRTPKRSDPGGARKVFPKRAWM